MKKAWILATLLALLVISTMIRPCATCIGRLQPDVPPFFTQDYDRYLEQQYKEMPDANSHPLPLKGQS